MNFHIERNDERPHRHRSLGAGETTRIAIALAAVLFATARMFAADTLQSKTTYSKAYGPTKGSVAVDPANDLPRYPAVEPKDAIATWKVKPGFKFQLAAHEPQVRDPIAVSFDERGRMFVVEMIDYSERRDETPHPGRVSMLEDKDGDGYYETSTVFADDLPWPTGVICASGGIYVIATPDVIFFKDTKGAGKADVREVVFTGLGTGLKLLNVQGLANCPQWGLDNRIHIQAGGGNRGLVKCLKRPDLPAIELGGNDFWFDPRTYEFGLEAGGAQYGMSFDNYGRKFACGNSDHLQYFVYDRRYAAQNPFYSMPPARQSIAADGGAAEVYRISPDEPWRIVRTRWRIAGVVKGMVEGGGRVSGYFTGATGTTVHRGDAYGPDFVNNTFTGDAGGQLVHRKKLYADGVSLIGKRPDDEQNHEFAASNDTWVRVVNFANAPDGCLHVIDMYREVIEHPWSIPEEIKKHLDLNNGNDRGRIYRIVPDNAGWQRRGKVDLGKTSTADLVKMLEHPNGWQRDCASRLLHERQDKSAVPLLEQLAGESKEPLAKIHALAELDGLGALSEEPVLKALADGDPFVRERGVLLAEKLITDKLADREAITERLPARLAALADDPDARVRFQLAFTVETALQNVWSPSSDPKGIKAQLAPALVKLALGGWEDRWQSAALLGGPPEIVTGLLFPPMTQNPALEKMAAPFIAKLIEMRAASKTAGESAALIDFIAKRDPNPLWLRALGEGLRRAGSSIEKADTEQKLAAIFTKAAATAADPTAANTARLAAIDLLELTSLTQSGAALTQCLAEGRSEAIQTAALKTLSQHSDPGVTKALLDHWSHYGAKAKDAALSAFVAREDRTLAMLGAIQSGAIQPTDLTASQVQSLANHRDAKIAAVAKAALASVIAPSRAEAIAKFKPALSTKGDAARGREIYAQRCISCHRVGEQGIQLGPDLVTVKTKGRDGILTAILEPNKEVAPQFIAYTVNTKDGQSLMGFITKDDASGLTLRMIGGAEQTIQRGQIKGSSSSGLSLMPEGLETGLDVQAMADLLTFIEELK
jgi:putative membrane-bound dehydrogenase-like protein